MKEETFVVLQTNTNHEDRVFGPFPTHEEAEGFMYKMAGHDHLHEFKVLPFEEPPEIEEEED